jgi:tetratricopeptide (TPR) repeat protein
MMQGRFDDAYQAAVKMVDRLRPMLNDMAAMADAFIATPVFVLERFHKWDEILQTPEPEARLPVTRAMWRYARTLAYVAKGDKARAAAEAKAFEVARAAVPADAPFVNNKASSLLAIAGEVIAARMAAEATAAIPHWRKAVELQDALIYDEPPPWYYPLRESLGAALLRAGKAAEAEQAFRDDLDRFPRNARSLFGLMHALRAQGKEAGAQWVKIEYEKSWKRAQVTLDLDTF